MNTTESPHPDEPETSTDHKVHRLPPKKSAYRRWFSSLNPSVQLVFCQLWMPTFMCIMFILCYVGPFQHASPRDVPVGIVGDTQVTRSLQQAADDSEPGTLDFEQADTHAEAQEKVKRGELGMAYDAQTNQLIVASAHQAQAVSIFPKLITPLLPEIGQQEPPGTDDVAPLPEHDIGMTPMYLMLAWCISGYLAAMFIGLMGGPLRRLTRYGIIIGVSTILSIISAVLVDLVLGAITGHFWALLGLGFCWSVAIGAAVNGLSYFMGRFIAVPSMVLFIFLSIPSSGAAMPVWMMPGFFQWMNNIVVGSGISEMLKHLVYGVGPGYSRGWIMLGCYLVIGALLTWVGKPYWEWKRVRRLLSGKRTMFQDAQRANGRKNSREENETLASYGLKVRESDGALLVIPPVQDRSHWHHASEPGEQDAFSRPTGSQPTGGQDADSQGSDSQNDSACEFIPHDDRQPHTGFSGTLDPELPDYGDRRQHNRPDAPADPEEPDAPERPDDKGDNDLS